jgi:mono/diheme cytochrome c family protein
MNRRFLIIVIITFGMIGSSACEMNSRGAKIFTANRCPECHTINGKGGFAGPNLTRVGSRHSREYFIEQIRNPGSKNTETSMPSFRELPAQDISDLADYLSGLK